MRVTVAAMCALGLVLSDSPRLKPLHGLVWLPVLAIACAKPTLGDTLEGWWFAASGGVVGCVVALPVLPLAALGRAFALVAMALAFFLIVLLLGDHIQVRRRRR